MSHRNSGDELVEHVEALRIKPTYKELVAQLRASKRTLEEELGALDDQNRELVAAHNESERRVEILKKENAELREIVRVNDDWAASASAIDLDLYDLAMEDVQVEAEEEEKPQRECKHWALVGMCRYAGAGEWCKHGYHTPKDVSTVDGATKQEKFTSGGGTS